jgi:N-acetylmuramoyl-L-alanine amidase
MNAPFRGSASGWLRSLVAVFVVAAFPRAQAADARIADIRFWSVGDVTRVAIETAGDVEYEAVRIADPDRLFLDLREVQPRRRGLETVSVGDRLLSKIRIAETQPGVTRVVFDLMCAVDYSVSQLRNPYRLIVELRLPLDPPALPQPQPPAGLSRGEPAVAPVSTDPVKPVVAPAAETAKLEPKPAQVSIAAKADSHGERSLIRALGLKLQRLVIDPGHGGHDTGTIGAGGLKEKDLVLDIARRLGEMVTERLGSEVIYTRTADTFIPLEERTALANSRKADLFLSIHANSSRHRRIGGPETYYLNFTTDPEALEVAARENATSAKSISELQSLVQKITLKEKVQESREFAETVQKGVYTALARPRGFRNRGVKKAPFVVLVDASMPAVLVEIGFLSNGREESLLRRPSQRQRVAEALYKALAQYAGTLSHYKVAKTL